MIEPIGAHILIRIPREVETKTDGGLYLPQTRQQGAMEAEVVAVGPGGYTSAGVLVPPKLEKGDHVLIPVIPQGSHFTMEGERYVFMKESEVYGKIVGTTAAIVS